MANIGYIQAVRHCNHFCGFCSNPPTPFFHTLETMKALVDDFVRRRYYGVILTGGEPTLHPELPAVIGYARNSGLHVRLITNGIRLADRAYAQELADAGLHIAHVTIYSTRPDVEEAMRGVPDTLEPAFAAVSNANAAGIVVNSNCVITKLNADHLDETIQDWIANHPYVPHFVWNNLDVAIGRAQSNRDTFLHKLADCEASLGRAMKLLDDSGRTFRVEKVPPCFMGEYAWASTETRKLIKGEERLVHFLDSQQSVRQTLWDDVYGEVCQDCSLREICPGVYSQGNGYSTDELKAVEIDPMTIVQKVISDDSDPSSASLSLESWREAFDARVDAQHQAAAELAIGDEKVDRRLRELEKPGTVAVGDMSDRSVAAFERRRVLSQRKGDELGVQLDPVLYPGVSTDALEPDPSADIQEVSGSRRLMLRLTTQCNLGCDHCTIADIAHLGERPTADCVTEIERGRQTGCTELVFMRGEPTLRRDLKTLTRLARDLGYGHIQLQTNGRMLVYRGYLRELTEAGCNFFEVSLFGSTAQRHDAIGKQPGAFEQTVGGLANLVKLGLDHMVTVPIIRATDEDLADTVRLLSGLGVRHVQFNFNRPFQLNGSWYLDCVARLSDCGPQIREALAVARGMGLTASTEAVPLCHLDEDEAELYCGDVHAGFAGFRVSDLHRETESMAEHRKSSRPTAPQCQGCRHRAYCPTTWAAYQEIFGTEEFHPR